MLTKGGLSKKRHVSHLADHTAFERKSKEQRTRLSHGGWPVSINPLLAAALWGKPDSTRDFVNVSLNVYKCFETSKVEERLTSRTLEWGVNGVKAAPPLIYISKRQSRELAYVNGVGGLVSQPTMKRIPKSVR
ncbi:hypothetical protein V1477_010243 [Vespula maculifrons]|uniref:Uncharacterized protein n=3 Tax=Vespula TaxID=7451 RepID=A0A834NUF6_VESGE|nr:hypothetical protein HZH66_000835 [Vespula vulgaris]KAF7418255.1 hypothetical protein HZH68_000908 [Vespula germanica]